ncbi:hypothetical protein Tco_1288610, partial [Tanacetum coccineum]
RCFAGTSPVDWLDGNEVEEQKNLKPLKECETSGVTYDLKSLIIDKNYKDGKVRYLIPRSRQNQRDLPRDNPLVSVEVLTYDYKRSNMRIKGIVRTEMELVLEHTQQGSSNEISDYIKMEMQFPRSSVSTEDANKKFLRCLPSTWSQVSLIIRTKPGVDSLSFDDLYNNLRVFESDIKGSTATSSSKQNVAFVSENTSSTNDVSTAYDVSNSSDHEDLKQLDEFDLEEMDLKRKVAMISIRMKKFYKKIGHFARECRSKRNQDSRRRDAWNTRNKDKDNRRRSGKQEDSKALVTLDGEGVDWTSHSKDEQENYALIAYNSSGSDTEMPV